MPEWDNAWLLDDMTDLATEDMDIGKGVWILTSAPATMTVLGEVASGDTYTVNVNEGFNLVANPFPSEISIQDIKMSTAGIDDEYNFQTTLRVWTGTGYRFYGWLDGDDGTNNDMPEWDNAWLLDDMTDLASETLSIGEAVWIIAPSAGTVTFTK